MTRPDTNAIAPLFLLLALAACKPDCRYEVTTDQKLRREVFLSCLEKAAKPPHSVHYNDEAEVVDECQSAAHKIASTTKLVCKEEPKP